MAKLLKLRRGTTSQHSSFTGAEGEVTIDTNKDVPVVHDGSTAGGHPVAAEDMANVSSASIVGRIGAGAIIGTKLENSGVTAGAYGSSSAIPIVTVDAQGLVTAASTTAIDSTTIANGSSSVSVANNGAITSNANHDFGAGIDITAGHLTLPDQSSGNGKIKLGAGVDLQLYHNGTDSFIENSTGSLYIRDTSGGDVRIQGKSGEDSIICHDDDGVHIYYDNAVKLTTESYGVNVTGNINVSGTVDGVNVSMLGGLSTSSGVLSNGVTATTQGTSDNTTKVATTAYVTTAVANAEPFPSGTKMLFQQSSAPTGWTKITSSVDNKALRLVSGNVSSGGNAAFTTAFASRTPAGNVGTSGNSTASFSANATTGNSTASFSGSVSGNTGNSGASTSSVSTSGSVNNHTLSNNQVPSHSHSFNIGNPDSYGNGYRICRQNSNNAGNFGTNSSGGGGSHSHGFSGSSHSHNVNNHTHSFSGNFSGNTGNHTHSVSVSGNTGNHTHSGGSFSGSAMDFAVQYIDVIVCSKD